MGGNPTSRILDFFIENKRESWALTEIHKQANVSYPSVKLIVPKLLEKYIIKVDKEVGKIGFYKINVENQIVKKLISLHKIINKQEIEKYIN